MKAVKFIWATFLCVALGMGIVSCGDDNEEIEPPSNTVVSGKEHGHTYVDLGLSVKWADRNVGALSPEMYGDYYVAWGVTDLNTSDWSTYKWCNGSSSTLTKYCTDSSFGTVDNKKILDLEDDAANVRWRGSWRMPTDTEMTELRENCIWEWTTLNDVNGYKVTSKKNGNSIFLPAAGYRCGWSFNYAGSCGYYWSSSLFTSYPCYAWDMYFNSSSVRSSYDDRYYGLSIRPVCP